jgi:hypothetical protein
MKDNITFRPITENDMDFLYRVYASTREDELAVTDWDDAQKEEFLKMQFNAQHVYYQEHYPGNGIDKGCDGRSGKGEKAREDSCRGIQSRHSPV